MIQRLRLMNYKGFEDFTLHFRETSFLIGPNNAGKSTVIGALRLCSILLSHAKRRKPEVARHDTRRDRKVVAYSVSTPAAPGFVDENIRYEFRDVEARIELHFKNKATLYVVWPSDNEGYFYVEHVEGAQPPHLKVVKDWYSTLAVVQTLAPIEHREILLTETYIRENLGSPLASRHFRNQLYYRKREDPDDYDDLCEYLVANTPEIESIELVPRLLGAPSELDLFFQESGTRTEKELYWAGDGLQIWLQILFHIWRQSGVSTLILDEPDVFLHPDLQRRLVHVLEDLKCQVILATHAPEILGRG